MRVLVAMSGGVDSSVAAAMLVADGHEVAGATLRLWGSDNDKGCCSVADVDDARRVAQVLGIDHHVFNYEDEFRRSVVGPFVDAHRDGRTPNPCVECNRTIKFDLLVERAMRLGFDAVATGHHARVVTHDGRAAIGRGADPLKDQSYVLGFTPPDVAARLLLPVGEMTKQDVRRRAEAAGLRTWDKPDSQDVCFIDARGRGAFLAERLDLTPATVVDATSGEVIEEVPAAQLVTVGQRRGIAAGPEGVRRYVRRVDLVHHRVEVDVLERVQSDHLAFVPASLVTHQPLTVGTELLVQVSAHGRALRGWLEHDGVRLAAPTRPVAPGQVVVLYDDTDHAVIGAAYAERT